jgi:hypothetical protein
MTKCEITYIDLPENHAEGRTLGNAVCKEEQLLLIELEQISIQPGLHHTRD